MKVKKEAVSDSNLAGIHHGLILDDPILNILAMESKPIDSPSLLLTSLIF